MNKNIANHDYARAFRAIGFDLADLFPEILEIEVKGKNFLVRGRGKRRQRAKDFKKDRMKRALSRLVPGAAKKARAGSSPPAIAFGRTYDRDDIIRLEELARSRRNGAQQTPDIYNLAERLRTIGKMLDASGASLVKLRKDARTLTIEYRDRDGETHKEECVNFALYKSQQQSFSQRGTFAIKDPWGWK